MVAELSGVECDIGKFRNAGVLDLYEYSLLNLMEIYQFPRKQAIS